MGEFAVHLKELAYLCGAVAAGGTSDSGTSTTFVDAERAEADDDHWNNHRIYSWAGAAKGEERLITDFVASSDTLTVAPAGTSPSSTTQYIILRKGWTMEMLRNAWKLALRQERRNLLLPKVDETLTFDTDPAVVYEYTVPSGFYAIQHILREFSAGDGNFTKLISPDFWHINRAGTRQVVFDKLINDREGFIVNGCALRLVGQQEETEPTADTSTLTVPTGNLILLAASLALESFAALEDSDVGNRLRSTARQYRATFLSHRDRMPLLPGSQLVDLD